MFIQRYSKSKRLIYTTTTTTTNTACCQAAITYITTITALYKRAATPKYYYLLLPLGISSSQALANYTPSTPLRGLIRVSSPSPLPMPSTSTLPAPLRGNYRLIPYKGYIHTQLVSSLAAPYKDQVGSSYRAKQCYYYTSRHLYIPLQVTYKISLQA